uniref:polyketide synthase dehydratase domain-containing protein n=1 Tax=Actibacterium sp. TaxID=1872125 RepID=UPI00356B12FD
SDVEIILGQGPWEQHESDMGAFSTVVQDAPPAALGAPLLMGAQPGLGARGGSSLMRVLSLDTDGYMDEHRLDGVPVLPMAVAMEMAAEAVAEVWPGWALAEITGHKMLAGIRLEDDAPREIELLVTGGEHGHSDGFAAKVEIRATGKVPRVHYRCNARLADSLPKGGTMPPFAIPGPSPLSAHQAYRDVLFHGPSFQAMTKLIGLDKHGIAAEIRPSAPASFGGGGWLFDPGLVDTAAQLVWVWSHAQHGKAALPNGIERARRYDTGGSAPARMELRIRPETDGTRVLADIFVLDAQGRMVMSLEGLESTADANLNRFCGWSGKIVA